ncbi:hypothetical protein D3C71_1353270 [compost metagenome]
MAGTVCCRLKLPLASVAVPIEVPFTFIDIPGIAIPESSDTFPLIVLVCAFAKLIAKTQISNINNLIFIPVCFWFSTKPKLKAKSQIDD